MQTDMADIEESNSCNRKVEKEHKKRELEIKSTLWNYAASL